MLGIIHDIQNWLINPDADYNLRLLIVVRMSIIFLKFFLLSLEIGLIYAET